MIPFGVIGIDVAIGLLLARARQGRVWWILVALLWTLVMPILCFAAYVAGAGLPTTTEARWQVTGLCALAGTAHASLVFGGGVLDEAFRAFLFLLSRRRFTRFVKSMVHQFLELVESAETSFENWTERVRTYNRDWPEDKLVVPTVPERLAWLKSIANQLLQGIAIKNVRIEPEPDEDGEVRGVVMR